MATAHANGYRELHETETHHIPELSSPGNNDRLQDANGAQEFKNENPSIYFNHAVSSDIQTQKEQNTSSKLLKPLVDRFIDEPRALNVAIIGGGLAGILGGILLQAKVPNIKLTIYDKNKDFVSY